MILLTEHFNDFNDFNDLKEHNSTRVVFGISNWPESIGEEFEIVEVLQHETDDEAIQRAKSHYDDGLECIVRERNRI